MNGFMTLVLTQKTREIAVLRGGLPAVADERAALTQAAQDMPVRDFAAAVAGGGIIAEIKRRSPSVDRFRQNGPVADLARIYAEAGAAAISIVTDELNFGTSLRDVRPVRDAVDLPVLVKDFVVDHCQIVAARLAGADCLLLIARLLSREQLRDLHDHVTALGMTALVECHSEADVAAALAVGARLAGVNSRNLESLSMDTTAHARLLPRLGGHAIPVAESGIKAREDINALQELGAEAFLVGGALLSAADPGALLRLLSGREGCDA